MPRGRRRRLAPGIYADAIGLAVVTWNGGRPKETRFPFGTPLETLKQIRARLTLERAAAPPAADRAPRGRFDADVAQYLKHVKHLAGWVERRSELRAWIDRIGTRARASLTRADVISARSAWLDAGKSPKTINNRIAALRAMFHAIDGHDTPTPADGIRPLPVQQQPPIPVAADLIAATAAGLERAERRGQLRDQKTRARFYLLAETGRRPSEIMRARRADFDLERRIWHVRDGKGGHTPGGIYLSESMIDAVRFFVAADAFGEYNTGSFSKVLRSAGWPAGVRPYTLRHSLGMALADAGADHMDIAAALGHKDPRTTRRHYVGVRESRTRAALERVTGRIQWQK